MDAFVNNQNPFYGESRKKANDLMRKIANKNLEKNGVQDARFLILRKTKCTGFMLELGYLISATGQNEIANKILQFLKEK